MNTNGLFGALSGEDRPDVNYVALMRRGEDASVTVPAAVGELWMKGASIAWKPPSDLDQISECERQPHCRSLTFLSVLKCAG